MRRPQIADVLGIKIITVEKHLLRIRRKLGAKSQTQAAMIAVRDKLFVP